MRTKVVDVRTYYKCEDCENEFEEDEIEKECYTDKLGDWYYDYAVDVCPYCHSEFIQEINELEEIEIEDDGE